MLGLWDRIRLSAQGVQKQDQDGNVNVQFASTKGLNVSWLDCHVDVMGRLQSIRVHLSWRNNLERDSFKE